MTRNLGRVSSNDTVISIPDEAGTANLTATALVQHLPIFAEHIFDTPIEVTEDDSVRGISSILEKKLEEAGLIDASTTPQRINFMISLLENELQNQSIDTLRGIGFNSGTIQAIRAGEILNLALLKETMYRLR